MVVLEPPVPGFLDFVRDNAPTWRNEPGRAGGGAVLVDLIHNNATLLCLNLIAARYLARLYDAEVVGLTAPTFTSYPVAVEHIRALAGSYGVADVVDIEALAEAPRRFPFSLFHKATGVHGDRAWRTIHDRLERLADGALRSATLGLTVEDLRLGDLVYDSLVYLSGQPTLERFDASLTTTLQRCRRLFVGMQRLLRQRKVCALVLSDRAYIDYGIPTRVALARQIPVYVRSGLNPSSIRKYNRLEQQSEFPDVESQAIVQHYRVKLGPQLAALADAFYPPAPSKVADFAYFRFGYGEGKREEVGEALARRLGLDPRKKTCCLMSHVFYDAPHVYPDTLFDDHFQWLVETLKFAAKTPALNWLVRQHPFEVMAGENAAFHRAVDRFVESGTVSVVPPEVTTSSLFSCVDAITTVHGSAGIEFPSAGIPCILAGRPFYGDYPFVVRARTRNEYFHALENIPGLGKVSGDALLLAKEVAFVEFKCLPVLCNRLPENGDLAGRKVTGEELAMWWRSAATLAAMTKAEDDPLFANLRELQPRPGVVLRI